MFTELIRKDNKNLLTGFPFCPLIPPPLYLQSQGASEYTKLVMPLVYLASFSGFLCLLK